MRQATLDTEDILDYIQSGITPYELEKAHRAHTVRELGKRCDVNQHQLKALSERWGINYGENNLA